ncbi:MAG: hypothetical protein GY749_20960 [Desulfobacteraceae bacterium]|nr:hypothetical protein [Desulfobacteraceae bacterium]
MGLNLRRISFTDWAESAVWESYLDEFYKEIEESVGNKLPYNEWTADDNEFPRVGSYTAYGIFWYFLYFLHKGDFEKELDKEDDIEKIALQAFREDFSSGSVQLPFADHFLETNDINTIFLPVFFEKPIKIYEIDIGSLPAVVKTLEALSEAISLDLSSEYEKEYLNNKWIPVATAKNVAKIIYNFFKKNPKSCVSFS